MATLMEEHEEQGLEITPRTSAIDRWGEPLDAYRALATVKLRDGVDPSA